MNKKKIKRILAIIALAILLFLIGLAIYFAAVGNNEGFFAVIAINTVFAVLLFFVLRFSNYVETNILPEEDEETKE